MWNMARVCVCVCVGSRLAKKTQQAFQLLDQLKSQVHAHKTKNIDILSLSQEVRGGAELEGGRLGRELVSM